MDFARPGEELRRRQMTLAIMESCTGGLLSAVISSTPGCGDYYLGGIISYATEIKVWAGVREETIEGDGVVSPETATEMAQVIRHRFGADIGIGITGVAGPKPQDGVEPGIVYVGIDGGDSFPVEARELNFKGEDPDAVKERTVIAAIEWLEQRLSLIEAVSRKA
jgi:PncC family amidohydrolase